MDRYLCYYMEEVSDVSTYRFDLFISGFDGCERTLITFNNINAKIKKWLIFPQYNVSEENIPVNSYVSPLKDEADYINGIPELNNLTAESRVCIDSTGIITPHLIYLIKKLKLLGVRKVDILYSEPNSYVKGEDTLFTRGVTQPKTVPGYSSVSMEIGGDDVLIVCAGYDKTLIETVIRDKNNAAHRFFIVGFPSMQADMYQQNLIQLHKTKKTIGSDNVHYCKAPAYDPFVTAQEITNIIERKLCNYRISNIYFSPLSTKAHAIAMALVYLYNDNQYPISIIYPYCEEYHMNVAQGIKRTWKYTIEF